MKKLAIALTLSAGVLSLTACNSDKEAVVETKAGDITKDEFYNELKDQFGDQVLKKMVTEEVLEDKYDVPKEDVDAEVKKLKDQYGDQFEMVLQKSGYKDVDAFRDVVKLSLLQEAAVSEDVKISDKEIKTQYERMKTEVKASHILVDDKKTAEEVEKKLENGGDFAKLAKEYSTDKKSAEKGGDVGYFSVGKMVPEFTDAAYNLKVGEVSDPVKSQFGYHIIKVTDKRDAKTELGSFKEEKDNIRRQILNNKVDPAKAQAKLDKLLKDADIDVKIDQYEDLFETEKAKEDKKSSKEDKSKSEDESKKDDTSKEEDAK
ncbi:foldase [Virgibacillus phasianinus]|uniref:Foldase protein PrsA n=1 Tax=Virgibacillus phasianinus TaxID=2017483 RepID=A0A220TYX4_9BACI|nr:peptidylprolyl isomerase [Virgibacillus phasianinus]ASK60873.1 foldase [Virgibacillus phasianinus]